MMWLARLARHTTFAPNRLGLFSKDWTLGRFCSLNLNLCSLGTHGVVNAAGVI